LDLEPFDSHEVHYMEYPGMFSSKTLISFQLKKERHEHLGRHGGVSKLSAKVNYSFNFFKAQIDEK